MSHRVNEALPPSDGPAPAARTTITLLLFIYLVGLAIAIFSNPRDGLYSTLQFKLRRTPGVIALLHLLWLDNGYDYVHFTGAFNDTNEFIALQGTDYQVVVDLEWADGRTARRVFPDVGRWPPVRYQRYKNLCRVMASVVGDSERESVLPALMCEWLLRETGAHKATLDIRNHLPQGRNQAGALEASVRDPLDERYYRSLFRGVAQRSEGKFIFLKLQAVGDSVPAPGQSGSSAAQPALPGAAKLSTPPASGPGNFPVRP